MSKTKTISVYTCFTFPGMLFNISRFKLDAEKTTNQGYKDLHTNPTTRFFQGQDLPYKLRFNKLSIGQDTTHVVHV